MLKIIICDDEEYIIEKLKETILKVAYEIEEEFNVIHYKNGEELIQKYSSDTDIVFLDISIGEVDGIQAAKHIRELDDKVLIIFITFVSTRINEGYKVQAYDFILKPIHYELFKEEFKIIVKKAKDNKEKVIYVKNDYGYYKIILDNISYITIEKDVRNISIIVKGEEIISYDSLNIMEEKLKGKGFYRCHKSYIINITYISKIEGCVIKLKSNEEIPISKRRRKDFKQYLIDYLGVKL